MLCTHGYTTVRDCLECLRSDYIDLLAERDAIQFIATQNSRELERMTAERNALTADIERERDGNLALRQRYGARDDETMFQFLDRITKECDDVISGQAQMDYEMRWHSLELKVRENAKQIVDLMHERDNEKRRCVYYQNIVYDVCARLDAALGGKTVCGTVDSPTTQVVERISMLIRHSIPHEDPRRTAYIVDLEREAEKLRIHVQCLTGKLLRIANLSKHIDEQYEHEIMDIVMEPLSHNN